MSGRPRKPEIATLVRDAMLDAATTVFAKKGYAAATMNEIAAEAGYTAAAFYKYFKGKEELFEALLDRVNVEVNATLTGLPPLDGLSFEKRVELLFRAGFELVDRRAEMFAMVAAIQGSGAAIPTRRMAERQRGEARRGREMLAAWLAAAAGAERVGPFDPNEAAMFYTALARGLYVEWAAERAEGNAKGAGRFVDRVPLAVRLFLYGITAPLTDRKSPRALRARG